ncbi:MAG: efflux RND transporter permease subunit [Pirellulaceae bacterium]
MLNAVIRFSLRQPLLILGLALLLIVVGLWQTTRLPIDVFPDLNRPRVVVITEAPGMAPEEVERLVNLPLESALIGATGVEEVRSMAGIGISVIFVEFDWGTDIYTDRQVVSERLGTVSLSEGVTPQLAPISSIMGQIMLVGMTLDESATGPAGAASSYDMLKLRQDADWIVRRRLLKVGGVAQVFTLGGEGGGQRQVQVLVDPERLRQMGVTLHQVEEALRKSNENATGGYIEMGPQRLLTRSLGRIESIDALERLVIDGKRSPPLLLSQVARVVNGPEIPSGLSAVNNQPAVMLVIVKQPGADTRTVTEDVVEALDELRVALPPQVVINTDVYRQDEFIDRAIENVLEALRDGGVLVVIVLFVFLFNFRTTLITLTAIPLSIFVTVLIFTAFDMSINTMTLGGLAVAIGELVDDAIVDVENIHRRLRINHAAGRPQPDLLVVFRASLEVRNSIVFGTMIVVLVFVPLFALAGMPGRLFAPLGVAYIVSILASLLVSLTVTPVMSYLLFSRRWVWPVVVALGAPAVAGVLVWLLLPNWALWMQVLAAAIGAGLLYGVVLLVEFLSRSEGESFVLRGLKWIAGWVIRFSLRYPWPVVLSVALAAAAAVLLAVNMGRGFLPPFNEGSVQVSVFLPPGTSLAESDRVGAQVDRALLDLDFVTQVGRRTGRAEEDEHVLDVNFSEIIIALDPESPLSREEQFARIRAAVHRVKGLEEGSGRSEMEQPIMHLMSHMISGVKAQIAVKIFGDDLHVLRQLAQEAKTAIDQVPGVVDVSVEQQLPTPQLVIKPKIDKLVQYGLTVGDVNHIFTTAMQGQVVSQVLEGEASFDLVVRYDDKYRQDQQALRSLAIDLPSGGTVPLSDVAEIHFNRVGPNSINREDGRRRIIVQCNATDRPISDVRDDIEAKLAPLKARLSQYGSGYYIEYGGQFESEQAATRVLLMLSGVSLIGIFLVLYTLFRSVNLALQVMAALPMAAIGAVAALVVTEQSLSVPSMVGFISLAGIASRNGILLIAHYLHLMRHEGEGMTREMVIRAGQERVAPVLMTALTSGIGLVPLAMAAGEPGKEILYPVATVIIGGLISSTLLDFFVHPALFWLFGRRAAEQLVKESEHEVLLTDEPEPEQTTQPAAVY